MFLEKWLAAISAYLADAMNAGALDNFKVMLLSIVLEALPFVLLSVIVSALLHNFISDDAIRRIIPKSRVFSIVPAALLGILFPVCDCGMVPIVRRLVLKGVPLHAAVVFMLAAPIVNPVVAAATSFAFRANPHFVVFRLGAALLVACLVGFLISVLFRGNQLLASPHHRHDAGCGCHAGDCFPGEPAFAAKLIKTIRDASGEFFEMGRYLLIGAMLGAAAQILLPRSLLIGIGLDPVLSVGVMILFAFLISVCSSADAFIAASFSTSFTPGSLIAFMVFGPMIDIKNSLMLLNSFRFGFVAWLSVITAGLCVVTAWAINYLLGV
jgi:uncharacterized membrane protein YraQ (UPF0718 family)